MKKMRVIVAAAGTAGHINPGLAIANKIKEEEPDSEIIFIGTDDKPLDKDKYGEELPEGFVVHPAFNQDTSLQGVWMSKYAPSKK